MTGGKTFGTQGKTRQRTEKHYLRKKSNFFHKNLIIRFIIRRSKMKRYINYAGDSGLDFRSGKKIDLSGEKGGLSNGNTHRSRPGRDYLSGVSPDFRGKDFFLISLCF